MLISSYLRQQIEYHTILWWTNQKIILSLYVSVNLLNFCHLVNDKKISDIFFLNADTADYIDTFICITDLEATSMFAFVGFKLTVQGNKDKL